MTYAILTDGPMHYPASPLNLNSAQAKVTTWSAESGSVSVATSEIPYTYVSRKKLKTGWREYWHYRRGDHETKLPGKPGDAEFHTKYTELLQQDTAIAERKEVELHTVSWLIDQYLDSAEYRALADSTQKDYARILEMIRPFLGPERYDCINRKGVKEVRDAYEAQPRTAHKIKQLISLLYTWADQNDLVPEGFNPVANLKKLKWKSRSIEIWSDEEIDLFLSRCQPFMRTPVLLALYTGQRCQDVAEMDWKAVQGGTIRVRQQKTDEPLSIAIHPVLKAHLDKIRTEFGGKIVRTADGKPINANALSSALWRAVDAIKEMPTRSMHGLRYASAGRLEAAGCSVVEISSIIGHRTYQMAMKYMRQRKDAEAAIAKMSA